MSRLGRLHNLLSDSDKVKELLTVATPEEREELVTLLSIHDEWMRELPLFKHTMWHSAKTSQRVALNQALAGNANFLLVKGGNRAGKSTLGAAYAICMAAGRDARRYIPYVGNIFWVAEWLEMNGIDPKCVPPTPGLVWVGSSSFAASKKQARKILNDMLPSDTSKRYWDADNEASAVLSNGGEIVSKAYEQFDRHPASWEGAKVRAFWLDEEPHLESNLDSAIMRTVDTNGRGIITMTPLQGKTWVYRRFEKEPSEREVCISLWGEDNPHIDQSARLHGISRVSPWLRAARDKGEFTTPSGLVYPGFGDSQLMKHIEPKKGWSRYRAIDWGAWSPHVLWIAKLPNGAYYVYREYAPRLSLSANPMTDVQLCNKIIEIEHQCRDTNVEYGVADSASKNAILTANKKGLQTYGAKKYAGSVIDQIEAVNRLIEDERLYVSRQCPVLIEEMQGYSWELPKVGTPTQPRKQDDHGPDALAYFALWQAQGEDM